MGREFRTRLDRAAESFDDAAQNGEAEWLSWEELAIQLVDEPGHELTTSRPARLAVQYLVTTDDCD